MNMYTLTLNLKILFWLMMFGNFAILEPVKKLKISNNLNTLMEPSIFSLQKHYNINIMKVNHVIFGLLESLYMPFILEFFPFIKLVL